MDLYEIRKKAKEKKEAEQEEAEGRAAPAPEEGAEEGAGQGKAGEPAAKKQAGKAKGKSSRGKSSAGKPAGKAAGKSARKKAGEEPEPAEVVGAGAVHAEPEQPSPEDIPEVLSGEPASVLDEFEGEGEIFLDEPDIPLDTLMQEAFESEMEESAGVQEPEPAAETEPVQETVPEPEPQAADKGPVSGPADLDGDEEAESEDIIEYLAFMLSEEEYAVKVSDIKEIIRPQKITMVPRAPDFVEGIFSLRGVIIPVFDIKKRLGFLDAEPGRAARILIVSDGGAAQGMIVDRVTGVARLKSNAIEPPPAVIGGVEAEYLEGIGRLDGRLLILFNTSRVLSMEG